MGLTNISSNGKVTGPDEFKEFLEEANKLILGKPQELKLALACLLSRGHILMEDLPGMGKTTFVMVISHLLGLKLNRVQFTNDILPADIIGTNIYDRDSKTFNFHPGPIFSEVVLGDELNRATPKTQSAFLQAMEEQAVTVDGTTHTLPNPFFLIATQNPTDQAGTYPLPESQLDRFMMRISLGYPSKQSEMSILKAGDSRNKILAAPQVLNGTRLVETQKKVDEIHISDALVEYVQLVLEKSRQLDSMGGLSPRAGLLLISAAKSWAYLEGRSMVLPEDIKAIAPAVLSHRLNGGQLTRLSSGEEVVQKMLSEIAVP
jgi:MoxR-like ATPase